MEGYLSRQKVKKKKKLMWKEDEKPPDENERRKKIEWIFSKKYNSDMKRWKGWKWWKKAEPMKDIIRDL